MKLPQDGFFSRVYGSASLNFSYDDTVNIDNSNGSVYLNAGYGRIYNAEGYAEARVLAQRLGKELSEEQLKAAGELIFKNDELHYEKRDDAQKEFCNKMAEIYGVEAIDIELAGHYWVPGYLGRGFTVTAGPYAKIYELTEDLDSLNANAGLSLGKVELSGPFGDLVWYKAELNPELNIFSNYPEDDEGFKKNIELNVRPEIKFYSFLSEDVSLETIAYTGYWLSLESPVDLENAWYYWGLRNALRYELDYGASAYLNVELRGDKDDMLNNLSFGTWFSVDIM